MKINVNVAVLTGICVLLTGCISPKAYVDTAFRKATYASVKQAEPAKPVKVEVVFQRNGEPLPKADKLLRTQVERVLTASGVLIPATDANVAAVFSVNANNIADMAAARAKGFKTGLTLGASGTMIDDNYEFKCSYANGSGAKRDVNYQHAIHTTIGKTAPPPGLSPTKLSDAFGLVVEDVILNCLQNMQLAGAL